jgi:CDP-diglyceride synthetase
VIIICFLYFYGLILLYITYLTRRKGEKGAFINNLANSIAFLVSITINLIIINIIDPFNAYFIIFPFDIFIFSFIILYIPFFTGLVILEKRKIEHGKRNLDNLKSLPSYLPLKYDIYRKLTHLVVLGIVFFYFTLDFFIQNSVSENIMVFAQNLVNFLVGVSLIGLLTADFTRILVPKYYPLKPVNQLLKEKELHMRLGPHISMSIGCFSIILLFGLIQPIGPVIICTSMIMAIFGDIASNLIGRTMGKRKIRTTNKTYEGLVGGIVVAFVSGLIILLLLKDFYRPENFGLIVIPLLGALMMGIIDYSDMEIDDNLSYNFILATALFFISILLF